MSLVGNGAVSVGATGFRVQVSGAPSTRRTVVSVLGGGER
jgi:hypothetical protein